MFSNFVLRFAAKNNGCSKVIMNELLIGIASCRPSLLKVCWAPFGTYQVVVRYTTDKFCTTQEVLILIHFQLLIGLGLR